MTVQADVHVPSAQLTPIWQDSPVQSFVAVLVFSVAL